jgi:hypothetical protein
LYWKGKRENRNGKMTFVEEMKSSKYHKIDLCFFMELPSVCNLHFSADFQGAETVWSYTLKESCGSPETDRVGLHRVSKH